MNHRRILLALLLILAFGGPVYSQDQVPPTDPETFHLFLLAGQSNMAGRAKVSDEDREPHPRILMFNKKREWVPATDPLHFDKPAMVGTGLGKSFAMAYAAAHPNVTVGLIPCAVGGSPIDAWKPGGFHKSTKTHPWDDAIERTQAALKSGTLKAILWHQGESDSNPKLAPGYEKKLHSLVKRFRSKLDAPTTPFLVGQLGQFPDRPWNESRKQVDAAHRSLSDHFEFTAFVSSDGLIHKGDKSHFNAESCRTFGRRYFEAYQGCVGKK